VPPAGCGIVARVGSETHEITKALQAIANGERGAAEELLPLVYDEMKELAHGRLRKVAKGGTIQTTDLVHESWMRLVKGDHADFESRRHFYGAAARAMRNILVEQARRKGRHKHGGDRKRLDVDEIDIPIEMPSEDVLALHEALESLRRLDKRKCDVVMLRYFAGLTIEETAKVLNISEPTVKRDWRFARVLLHEQLNPKWGGKTN